ncbi:AraC family transcriptional regulator [[Enterobacter] lignolyticus]|uniref:AraC family transcriptional regulator n=1 Tax=[Enterobacter] lignolyticus TaxID=1334193 RepID=A0A806XFW3_9ENTR|nr:AraC family transcriptional regulator [[Enterobacter] lignolyticus]ALR78703.1 AraC family transcriptional regulator [[Enterobacter] lignolyticus]
MDTLSHLLALLSPRCEVNLHCRFGGRWQAGHDQLTAGVVPWHVILQGEGRLVMGGQTFRVQQGDVVLLPYGSPHMIESLVDWGQVLPVAQRFNGTVTELRTDGGEPVEMLCGEFYFGPHIGWLFADSQPLIRLHTHDRHDCPELETLLNMLVRESLAGHNGSAAIVQSLATTFLALLMRILMSSRTPPAGLLRLMTDSRLTAAVMAVLENPQQPWTLESMAARSFLSRATFARHFASSYHLTPQTWLTRLRMAMAARLLLAHRQRNIEEVAAECGFRSLASFSRAFKKAYGVTPGEWRLR